MIWGALLDYLPANVYVLGIMNLEDIEKATDAELRQKALECFEEAPSMDHLVSTILLRKARFYLDELERRKNDNIARRDFRMELIVIFLIGLELVAAIVLAIYGGQQQTKDLKQELTAFEQIHDVLAHLQDTSKATADSLVLVNNTMKTMELSLQKQVELFYDVQINVVYNESTKKLMIINNGRSNITVWTQRVGKESDPMLDYPKPDLIAPAGTYEIALEDAVKTIAATLPKGEMQPYSFTFLVKNEKQERFTVNGLLIAVWHGETVSFNIPNITLVPGWNRK